MEKMDAFTRLKRDDKIVTPSNKCIACKLMNCVHMAIYRQYLRKN